MARLPELSNPVVALHGIPRNDVQRYEPMFPVEVEYLNTSKKEETRRKNRDDKEKCYTDNDNDQKRLSQDNYMTTMGSLSTGYVI